MPGKWLYILFSISCVLTFTPVLCFADIYEWQAILLNEESCEALREYVKKNGDAEKAWNRIYKQAEEYLKESPRPIEVIYYEGLLDSNIKRIQTVEALMDMRKLAYFYYADIITRKPVYKRKIKEFILAWVNAYKPTGNPVNENKLEAIYLAYSKNRFYFSKREQQKVDTWIKAIAEAELNRKNVPMTNWQTKRIKLILYSGIILNNTNYKKYTVESYKEYVSYSLRPDGSSLDFEQRDALAYHIGGIKPLILFGIVYDQFKKEFSGPFNAFTFEASNGSSVRRSVDFLVPFAVGENQHKEWVNSQVKLDHERAAAGLPEYLKGKLFEPSKSISLFEMAMYFDKDYRNVITTIFDSGADNEASKSWTYYVLDAISSQTKI